MTHVRPPVTPEPASSPDRKKGTTMNNTPQPIIEVRHLRREYPVEDDPVVALDDVSLDIARGEICCIFGPSGSGKSTLLNQLAGLEPATSGAVRSQKIPMKALNMDKSSSPSCTVSFTYEYVDGDPRLVKTAQERIAIPVTEPDRFEREAPKDLTPAVAGQEYTLSVPYNNKGKGTVYNLEAYVEGDMTTLSPKQNLGNIDSGRSGSIDLILTPQEAGDHTFKAVIAWENTAGEEVKKSFELTLPVQENIPAAPEGGEMMPMEEETPSIPWGWLAAGLIVLAAAAFWWLRSRKKKKATLAKPGDVTALFDNPEPENSDSKNPKSGPDSHETL